MKVETCRIPKGYRSDQEVIRTERLIQETQQLFEEKLFHKLNLQLVSCPLFLSSNTGLNDNLNGIERPVSFVANTSCNSKLEVVHSLAKWKRNYLGKHKLPANKGIITRMLAIRRDEDISNLHSFTVDQWDWESVIPSHERSISTLKDYVRSIYEALRETKEKLMEDGLGSHKLPKELYFIHSEELLQRFPDHSPKERESLIAKEHGAVFIIGIGGALSEGLPHDLRAPDYDDWSTIIDDKPGLNGDLIVWSEILEQSIELSSMGVRVDATALSAQLKITKQEERRSLPFHQKLLNGDLPSTIGGGIGRSRVTLFLLEKAHIGEVQTSFWPDKTREICAENDVVLLS